MKINTTNMLLVSNATVYLCQKSKQLKIKTMNTQNLKIVSETEKAIQFEVGFKYNENRPSIVYGVNGNENFNTGYIVTAWVPKSVIVDGSIPAWFVKKEIFAKFGRFLPIAGDVIFS